MRQQAGEQHRHDRRQEHVLGQAAGEAAERQQQSAEQEHADVGREDGAEGDVRAEVRTVFEQVQHQHTRQPQDREERSRGEPLAEHDLDVAHRRRHQRLDRARAALFGKAPHGQDAGDQQHHVERAAGAVRRARELVRVPAVDGELKRDRGELEATDEIEQDRDDPAHRADGVRQQLLLERRVGAPHAAPSWLSSRRWSCPSVIA